MVVLDVLIVLHRVAPNRKGRLSLLPQKIIEFKSVSMKSLCVFDHCLFPVACLPVPRFC